MEIPSTHGGVITELLVKVGDKLSEGDLIAKINASDGGSADAGSDPAPTEQSTTETSTAAGAAAPPADTPASGSAVTTVIVPDIGDFEEIEVIEVLVSVGDTVAVEQSLITLESDKASMEIPSTVAGTVTSIAVSVGTKLSHSDPILDLSLIHI